MKRGMAANQQSTWLAASMMNALARHNAPDKLMLKQLRVGMYGQPPPLRKSAKLGNGALRHQMKHSDGRPVA